MDRGGFGNSSNNERRAIPRYGLSNARKLSEVKAKVDSGTGDQIKLAASATSANRTSHSFIKIPTPSKIAKHSCQQPKDAKDSKEPEERDDALNEAESKEIQVLDEVAISPAKETVTKPISARTSAPKVPPGRMSARQASANKILLPLRGKANSEIGKPLNSATHRARTTTGATAKLKAAQQPPPTEELSAKQKSISLNQIPSGEPPLETSASHQSLQQKLNSVFVTQAAMMPNVPNVPTLDIGDAKSIDTQSSIIAETVFKKASNTATKRKTSLPPFKSRDFKKYGSFDSVHKLGRSDKDAQPHAVTGRDRVMENKKVQVFEAVEKQLEALQSDFMNKYENLKATSPDRLKHSYKFITMIKDNDCKLIVSKDDHTKIPKKIPASSLSYFKEKIKDAMYASLSNSIDQFKMTRHTASEALRMQRIEELRAELEKVVVARLEVLYNDIDVLCEPKETDPELELIRLQRELQESEKNMQTLERKLAEVKKLHSEEKEALEEAHAEKTNTILLTKETTIAELNRKLKKLEKDFESTVISLNEQAGIVTDKETQLKSATADLKDYQQKLIQVNAQLFEMETERIREREEKRNFADKIDSLERMLQASKTELDEMKQQRDAKQSADLEKLRETIATLTNDLQTQKRHITEANNENSSLKKQLEKFEVDHVRYGKMREEYLAAKKRICELESIVDSLKEANIESKVEEMNVLRAEVEKLRASESEKRRDIDKLKMDLAKEHYIKMQLEEHIKKDEELLDARANLINDLQSNELDNRQRCEALMVQNAEKHRTIHEVGAVLNTELQTKSQEFRQLQESLREKCEALSRQDHMIRMLEQSNERNQKLRIKYEEKIARLEAEKRHLKDTIDLYSQNLIAPNLRPPSPNGRKSPRHNEHQQPQQQQHQQQQQQHHHHHHHRAEHQHEHLASTTATNTFTTTDTTTSGNEFVCMRQAPAPAAPIDAAHYDAADESDSSAYDFQEIRNTRHLPMRQRDNRIHVRKYEK